MIFLTVGTQKFQFDRLLEAVDRLIDQRIIQDTVIAQSGHSTYVPRNYQAKPFLEPAEFEEQMKNCDLLIAHGGLNTILNGLSAQKKMIVVPRKKIYSEHVDDHQKEIADKFEEMGRICVCREISELGDCYKHIRSSTMVPAEIRLHYSNTAEFINKYLEELR